MNLNEAKVVADKMTYADAVYNAIGSKCVPYRKATKTKLKELLEIAKSVDEAKAKGCDEISTVLYYDGFNDGYSKAFDNLLKLVISKYNDDDKLSLEELVEAIEQQMEVEKNE